ncbi:anaerobic ribonucleoside-triphosphate reductase activating protein [Lachnospiraceae bacterium 54-53]
MKYHNITYPDMNNGSGLRVVLWLSGCSHKCNKCQNPQTWDTNSGIIFDESAENELFEALSKDYISGITLSGGDPLHENNISEVLRLCEKIRLCYENKKSIWLYTGYYWSELRDLYRDKFEVVKLCDVLVDGPYIDELKDPSYPWAGSVNQSVIDVQKSLRSEYPILWGMEA